MEVIFFVGGLGNQMFQYAYGRCKEIRKTHVVFDISSYHCENTDTIHTPRNFQLLNFNLQTKSKFVNKHTEISTFFLKAYKCIMHQNKDRYFQDEDFFISIRNELKKEFVLKKGYGIEAKKMQNHIVSCSSISIHIRRGDYVTNQAASIFHGICDVEYYLRAIDHIRAHVVNPKFFVFSDDITWAQQHFIGNEYVFVSRPGIEDVEELLLMSECQHHIIANSTFSWWGAWLTENANTLTIAPKRWFQDEVMNQKSTIVPQRWIRL